MNKLQSIAGVVLTLNEEQDLARALASLSWCDELLVVDSGSTDSTHSVATQFGAQFIQHIQEPPFLITDQRNWSLNHAGLTSDWVIFLDADEEVSPQLAAQIITCVNSSSPFDAYELTPRYLFMGHWLKRTQGYPNWHPRLLKRGYVHFVGGVWESFSTGSHVGRISYPYEHYAFSKGLDDWLERHKRYSTWDASQIYAFQLTGRQPSTLSLRKPVQRLLMSKAWYLRPLLRFFHKYIFNLGFLDGWKGLLFALLMFFYELMTVIKVIELNRRAKGADL